VTGQGRIRPWSDFRRELDAALSAQRAKQGGGLRFLTETVTSPTLADQLRGLLNQFPQAKWNQYEPLSRDNARAGARLAFGQDVAYRYRLDAADVVLALEADGLAGEPGYVRYIHDFAARRRSQPDRPGLSRIYAVESTPSALGVVADHRLPLPARQVEPFARAVAAALGLNGLGGGAPPAGVPAAWLQALVGDLQQHRGASLVLVGQAQPPTVHALAHALNGALGNVGRTIEYTDPVEAAPIDQTASLRELVDDMQAGRVELLAIVGGNPAYSSPADLPFA
jgi:molybdopterin-containing oxidoreductase family iron-sulfur binding subunit